MSPAALRLVFGPVELVFVEPGRGWPVVDRGAFEGVASGDHFLAGAAWRRLVPPGVEQRDDRPPQLWADGERFAADDPPQRACRDADRGGHARAGVAHRDESPKPPHGPAGRGMRAPDVGLVDGQEPGGDLGLHRGSAGVGDAVHSHGPGPGGLADRVVGASGSAQLQHVLADQRGADQPHDASASRCRLADSGVPLVSGSASTGRSAWRRADARVRAISRSSSPVLRAASASSPRSVSPASKARLAAQNRPSFRLPSCSRETQSARRPTSVGRSAARSGHCCGSGSSTGGITRVWDLPSGQKLWEHQAHAGRVRSMAFDSSGSLLLTGGGDGMARLWRFPGGEKTGEFTHDTSSVRAVALDAPSDRIAVGCGPGEIYVHDLAGGQDVAELHGHSGRVLTIGFTTDPDVLISAAADGTIRAWSLTGQKQLAEVRADASLQAAALDASNGIVLAASAGGTMAIRIPTA